MVDGRQPQTLTDSQMRRQTHTDSSSHICSQAKIHKHYLTKPPTSHTILNDPKYSRAGPAFYPEIQRSKPVLFFCNLSSCETSRIIKKSLLLITVAEQRRHSSSQLCFMGFKEMKAVTLNQRIPPYSPNPHARCVFTHTALLRPSSHLNQQDKWLAH